MWDHTVLPVTRHKWTHPALTTARHAGTQFTYPRGMEGWVDLGDLLHTEMVYLPNQICTQSSTADSRGLNFQDKFNKVSVAFYVDRSQLVLQLHVHWYDNHQTSNAQWPTNMNSEMSLSEFWPTLISLPSSHCTALRNLIIIKIFQQRQLNSRRFPVFPGVLRRHPVVVVIA